MMMKRLLAQNIDEKGTDETAIDGRGTWFDLDALTAARTPAGVLR
jgi:hypothetical protein